MQQDVDRPDDPAVAGENSEVLQDLVIQLESAERSLRNIRIGLLIGLLIVVLLGAVLALAVAKDFDRNRFGDALGYYLYTLEHDRELRDEELDPLIEQVLVAAHARFGKELPKQWIRFNDEMEKEYRVFSREITPSIERLLRENTRRLGSGSADDEGQQNERLRSSVQHAVRRIATKQLDHYIERGREAAGSFSGSLLKLDPRREEGPDRESLQQSLEKVVQNFVDVYASGSVSGGEQ